MSGHVICPEICAYSIPPAHVPAGPAPANARGGLDLALGEDELFERMCAWDDRNWRLALAAAATQT